jgi:hypothetical protein
LCPLVFGGWYCFVWRAPRAGAYRPPPPPPPPPPALMSRAADTIGTKVAIHHGCADGRWAMGVRPLPRLCRLMELVLRISPPLHVFPAGQRAVRSGGGGAVEKHVGLRLEIELGPT